MAAFTLGQALVTDPGTGGAGGYALVAASPLLSAEERAYLAAHPQVSDYLHLLPEANWRPFLSFYRLPSGRLAFERRFAHGQRRGSFHRLVVHTLVLDETALAALDHEPRLLVELCLLRDARGGRAGTWTEWGASVAQPGLASLPDLTAEPQGDPRVERLALLAARRAWLTQAWGRETLEATLAQGFAALEIGQRLLLPQDPEHEQALGLCWSCLPPGDRLATAWTTHLAPGVATLFQLANAPSPEDVRRDQARPEGWHLLGELRPSVDGAALWLARAVVGPEPQHGRVDARLATQSIRRPVDLVASLKFAAHESRLAKAADTSLAAFEEALDHAGLRGGALPPGCGPEAVVEWALAVTATESASEAPLHAAPRVRAALARRALERWLVPERLMQVAARVELPRAAVLALGLAAARAERDPLPALEAWAAAWLDAPTTTTERNLRPVLAALAADLARAGSARTAEALRALGPDLDDLLEGLSAVPADVPVALALARAASGRAPRDPARRAFLQVVAPTLAVQPDLWSQLEDDEQALTLETLVTRAPSLTAALTHWPDDLYDRLVKTWSRVLATDTAAMRPVLVTLAAAPAALARERPALIGLPRGLRAASAPPALWVAFVLAEAVARERLPSGASPVECWEGQAPLNAPERRALAVELRRALGQRAQAGLSLGCVHRRLVEALAPALAEDAGATLKSLSALAQPQNVELADWANVAEQVARALDQARQVEAASRLRLAFARAFAGVRWSAFPGVLDVLMRALRAPEAAALGDAWGSNLGHVGRPGEQAFMARLAARAPQASTNLRRATLVSDVRQGRASLSDALRLAFTWPEHTDREWWRGTCHELRDALPGGPAQAVLDLFLDTPPLRPALWWAAWQALGSGVTSAIANAEVRLPPVRTLVVHDLLLLVVAEGAGRRARLDKRVGAVFLADLVQAERFDGAGTLLRAAGSQAPALLAELQASAASAWQRLRAAADHATHRWDLEPWTDALRTQAAPYREAVS